MDFRLTNEQSSLQEKIRDYCRKEITPRAAEMDSASTQKAMEMMKNRFRSLAKEGFLGLGYPVEAGGSGGDLLSSVLLMQELGAACPATGLAVLSSVGLCARIIFECVPKAVRGKYLGPLLKAEAIGAYGALEPEASLDDWDLKTTASPSTGGFALNGVKGMVLNAPLADIMVFSARVDGSAGIFLVTRGAKGLEVSSPQEKMGCRGVPSADVTLRDCQAMGVSPEAGEDAVAMVRSHEHLLIASVASGILNNAMISSALYARDRQAGDKPLGRHQEISFKLAEDFLLYETSIMLIYRCVWMMDEKNSEASVLASSAKLLASEAAVQAANRAMQIMGKDGYQCGSMAERLYRDAKLVEILGDTTEKHRMFIADQVLARY